MPNFATSDGQVIVIDKGGEQLLDNTYGFELRVSQTPQLGVHLHAR